MKTVHVAIGNSDDKLTQVEWVAFIKDMDATIRNYAIEVHGAWHSFPDSKYQNAAWAFDINPDPASHDGISKSLKYWLQVVAMKYRQDTIAWNESETQLLQAGDRWDG